MTHHTDAERAEFEAAFIAEKMRLSPGSSEDFERKWWLGREDDEYREIVAETAWWAWQAARRAPAAPVPKGWKLVPDEANMTDEQAEAICRLANVCGGGAYGIYRAALEAAPQPPEANPVELHQIKNAAPVQLPEPSAWMLGCQTMGGDVGWKLSWSKSGAGVCHRLSGEEFEHPLYTEQQVREILKAHGINIKKSEGE